MLRLWSGPEVDDTDTEKEWVWVLKHRAIRGLLLVLKVRIQLWSYHHGDQQIVILLTHFKLFVILLKLRSAH